MRHQRDLLPADALHTYASVGLLLLIYYQPGTRATKPRTPGRWRCHCACGNETDVTTGNLRRQTTLSCGCYRRATTAQLKLAHGRAGSTLYMRWGAMIQRCTNPKCRAYRNYGGRGIRVCERWRTFENFAADMGDPPPGMTLERKENDGDYEPGNCVWASYKVQASNRRRAKLRPRGARGRFV